MVAKTFFFSANIYVEKDTGVEVPSMQIAKVSLVPCYPGKKLGQGGDQAALSDGWLHAPGPWV